MDEKDEFQVAEWLRDGITAAKAGQRAEARELLMRVIEVDERNEQAWFWLSEAVDSHEDRLICLENVLTLNPGNVQARAGVSWLRQREVALDQTIADQVEAVASESGAPAQTVRESPDGASEPVPFMVPDGCVYCGLSVGEGDWRCPHCKGRLASRQFTREQRSPVSYLLHPFWIILAAIDLVGFFVIGYVWESREQIPKILSSYMPYVVGPVVSGTGDLGAFVDAETAVRIVRAVLLILAALNVLVAAGLFIRRPLAYKLGLALMTVHLVAGLALLVLGFLGYLTAAIWGLLTLMVTVFMFNAHEDFSEDVLRERLAPDRRLVNDVDFYSRGRAYEKRRMWAKALLHWRRAAAINPQRDTYYAAMARAYVQLGRYDQALDQMDAALQVSRTPDVWRPLHDLILETQRSATGPRANAQRRPTSG